MLQLILILTLLGILFYFYAIKPMSYWKTRGVKQGKPVWLFGDNWGPILRIHSMTDMIERAYNAVPGSRYSGMYQFTVPTFLVKDPELIKLVGVKDFEYFMDHRTFIPEKVDPLFCKNLFFLKGQNWRDMRPILSPTFTSSKMKAMFVLMTECGQSFVNYFLKKDQDIVEMEFKANFSRFANDVIASTAFGVKTDSLEQPNNEFYQMGKTVTNFGGFKRMAAFFGYFIAPKVLEFFNVSFFGEEVNKFFTDLVDRTIKVREEKGIIRPDMIQLLMEAKKGVQHKEEKIIDTGFAIVEEADLGKGNNKEITNFDIAAQAMIFFFAGFDGVSSLMCFICYELAINPDIQKRLRDEVLETLEACDGSITYEALLKMKYLDMVISETLRKWPLGVSGDRICTKSYTIPPVTPDEELVCIEKGTAVWIPIWAIHRDPKYYPNPERFDPERFNDENKGSINPYTFLPFGVGPRNCIGSRYALLETKVVLFQLLCKFEVVPTAKTKIPLKLSKANLNVIPDGGIWLGLKRTKKLKIVRLYCYEKVGLLDKMTTCQIFPIV